MKKFTKLSLAVVFTYLSSAALAFAQNDGISGPASQQYDGIGGFFNRLADILAGGVVNFLFALAFVFFFWGVVMYVINPSDEGKKERGRQYIIWGLIGLTVMFAVYGLINIVSNTFFGSDVQDQGAVIPPPKLPQ